MILIVGLGNPGKKYKNTRHNIGFRIIDALNKKISNQEVVLFKPSTFMNNSGQAVKKKVNNLSPENLIVVHDDIDLPLGTVRVSKNKSSAGHKGVQSIIEQLGTQQFTRIRIGIQPPNGKPQNTDKFVLKKFDKQEEKIIGPTIEQAVEIIKNQIN